MPTLLNLEDITEERYTQELQHIQNKSPIEKVQWITGIANIPASQDRLAAKIKNSELNSRHLNQLSILLTAIGLLIAFVYRDQFQHAAVAVIVCVAASLLIRAVPLHIHKQQKKRLLTMGIEALITDSSRSRYDENRFKPFKTFINHGKPIRADDRVIAFDEDGFDRHIANSLSILQQPTNTLTALEAPSTIDTPKP